MAAVFLYSKILIFSRIEEINTNSVKKYLKYKYFDDKLYGFNYNEVDYYYLRNTQGDITSIINRNGIEVARYTYDAWGNHVVNNLTEDNIGDINPFRYRGYYYDKETGLYSVGLRYYDPEVGRWINADDIAYLDPESINGLNLYAYCLNNPVMMVDPTGCSPKWWQWLVTGLAIVGGAALCFVPGAQGLGVALLVAGGSMLASNIMSAAGVDGKAASIISSGLNIVAGIALCFTPFAGIGASMIGCGIGGIAGGYISEALGFRFETGAMIGSIVGGIVGGKVYDAYKVAQIAKQGTVVIGETMGRVTTKAGQIGAGTYGGMPGYNAVSKVSPAAANQLGLAHNATWISRVYRLGANVVDIGINSNNLIRSTNYSMEWTRLLRWFMLGR